MDELILRIIRGGNVDHLKEHRESITGELHSGSGQNYLMVAASTKHEVVVSYLCSLGIFPINQKDFNGRTALHMAAALGSEEVINVLLLQDGINVREKKGRCKYVPATDETPFLTAVSYGNIGAMKCLLPYQPPQPEITLQKNNALHLAAERSFDEDKILILSGHPSFSTMAGMKNIDNKAPHELITNMDFFVKYCLFLKKVPSLKSLSLRNKDNELASTWAIRERRIDLVKTLDENGAFFYLNEFEKYLPTTSFEVREYLINGGIADYPMEGSMCN